MTAGPAERKLKRLAIGFDSRHQVSPVSFNLKVVLDGKLRCLFARSGGEFERVVVVISQVALSQIRLFWLGRDMYCYGVL